MTGQPLGREELLELVAAYALGTLPTADVPHVAAYVLGDPDARREYDDLRKTADLIAITAEEPVDSARSARMRERLRAAVSVEHGEPRRPRATPPSTVRSSAVWGTALAAAAAVVFALVSVIQNLGLRSDLAEAQRHVAALQTAMRADQAADERNGRALADLAAPDAVRYANAYGAVIRRGSHLYLALTGLPPLPRGHVYEAWTQAKGTDAMSPSVTFALSPNGVTLVPLPEDATRIGAIALSVEPDGGSKTPTTKPTLVQPLG